MTLLGDQAVADAAQVDHVDGIACIALDRLADVMDVPFGQFLGFARVRLVALRFGDQGLIVHYVGGVADEDEQIIERSGRQADGQVIDGDAAGMQVKGQDVRA